MTWECIVHQVKKEKQRRSCTMNEVMIHSMVDFQCLFHHCFICGIIVCTVLYKAMAQNLWGLFVPTLFIDTKSIVQVFLCNDCIASISPLCTRPAGQANKQTPSPTIKECPVSSSLCQSCSSHSPRSCINTGTIPSQTPSLLSQFVETKIPIASISLQISFHFDCL